MVAPEPLARSQLALLSSQALRLGLGLAVTAALGRGLGDGGFAAFVLLATWLSLAARVVDAGVSPALVASLARGEGRDGAWPRVLRLRRGLALGVALLAALGLWTADLPLAPAARIPLLAAVLGAILLLPERGWAQVLTAARSQGPLALAALVAQVGFAIVAGAAAFLTASGRVGASAGVLIALSALTARELAVSLAPRRLAAGRLSEAAAPVARRQGELLATSTAALAAALYLHVDVLLVEALAGEAELVAYGVGVRILGPLLAGVAALLAPVLPLLAGGIAARGANLAALVVALTMPPAALLVFGEELSALVLGRPLPAAAAAMRWLVPVAPLAALSGLSSAVLVAGGRAGRWARIALLGLGVNLVLDLLWIPELGALGAARATLVTEALVAVLALLSAPPTRAGLGDALVVLVVGGLGAVGVVLLGALIGGLEGLVLAAAFGGGAALALHLSPAAVRIRRGAESEDGG